MSRVSHCINNGQTEGFLGIIKSQMYQMYEITNETSLHYAIKDYIQFYSNENPQSRYSCKTPAKVRAIALNYEFPRIYPIPKSRRIKKYKEK